MVYRYASSKLSTTNQKTMKNPPNFAAWSNENLANFAADSYLRMQEQQEALEQFRSDLRDAMNELRKLTSNALDKRNTI
jgi:hypothetical protein